MKTAFECIMEAKGENILTVLNPNDVTIVGLTSRSYVLVKSTITGESINGVEIKAAWAITPKMSETELRKLIRSGEPFAGCYPAKPNEVCYYSWTPLCERCNKPGEVANDPYMEEIHNKKEEVVLCDECYKAVADDV